MCLRHSVYISKETCNETDEETTAVVMAEACRNRCICVKRGLGVSKETCNETNEETTAVVMAKAC